ncbi:MAG: alkaline phosphatase family protein [Polyangiaceae bacterium]
MRSGAGLAAGLLAAGSLGALSSCGVGSGYRAWWDQDKGATARPAGATDGGPARPADAAVESGAKEAGPPPVEAAPPPTPIQTVFLVLMSRQPWSAVEGSASAPYINGTLLPAGAHCLDYRAAPAKVAQSEPNAVWLEAGQDFGFTSNAPPSTDHTGSTRHLVDQLEAAGISWKAYVEGTPAGSCPIDDASPYRTFHVPFLFFDDVVGNPPSTSAKRCVEHVVPFSRLATDLSSGQAPRYAFVVPDLCDDMHDDCNTGDPVNQGDTWLAATVPGILGSTAYATGGAVFIAWDFSPGAYDPIGFIALSAHARPGFAGSVPLTHSSTLLSLQEIFGLTPPLGDAANATDLAGMFTSFP